MIHLYSRKWVTQVTGSVGIALFMVSLSGCFQFTLNNSGKSHSSANNSSTEDSSSSSKEDPNDVTGTLAYSSSSIVGRIGKTITANTATLSDTEATVTYTVSPTLPAGLTVNSSTGKISGTPTAASSNATYTITAKNSKSKTIATATVEVKVYDFGNGQTGAVTISAANTQVNSYTHVTTASVSAGATSFDVSSATGFAADDMILIIQNQGSGALHREFATIQSISGTTITLKAGLQHAYSSNTFDQASASATQIVKVPQYTDLTVTAAGSIKGKTWDGYSGGIIVFRANGTVTINGAVNAVGIGYRPGAGTNCGSSTQGESWSGKGIASTSENNGAGGGGQGCNCANATGGGGSYGTASANVMVGCCGTAPPDYWLGSNGSTFGSADLSTLYFGPGGGGQTRGGCTGCGSPSVPGTGGGMIIIDAYQLEVSGGSASILANGSASVSVGCWAASGGGAGGSILLRAETMHLGTQLVQAVGGVGGSAPSGNGQPVNPAGSGRIRIDYVNGDSTSPGTTNPAAGYTGVTTVTSPIDR